MNARTNHILSGPAHGTQPQGGRAPARRGSILVLVVGVVALMAIVVVVYASLGQTDRRRAEALSKAGKLGDQSVAVGDYLASVVARGAFKTQAVQRTDPALPLLNQRVAMDYPSIDPSLIFDPTDSANSGVSNQQLQRALAYDASGSVRSAWTASGGGGTTSSPDPRFAFDAFLASAQPANLRFTGDRSTLDSTIEEKPYVADRDWRMISNAAPDGRFVNLATLRNNFGAESGVGLGMNGKPKTTYDLTLLNDANVPGLATPLPTRDIALPLRTWSYDPGSNTVRNDVRTGLNAAGSDANTPGGHRPADFTLNQAGLLIPLTDARPGAARVSGMARLYVEAEPATLVPGDQEYLANQYADADGDGLADSRWFELVDASDPANIRSVIPADPDLRLFVATRIIDLSGKVNVNTASTFAQLPDARHPAGFTPADVDLERILSMRGTYSESFPVATSASGYAPGYEEMAQPDGPGGGPSVVRPGNYSAITTPPFPGYAGAGPVTGVRGFAAVGASGFAGLLDTLVRGSQAPRALAGGGQLVPDALGVYPAGFVRPFEYGLDGGGRPITFFADSLANGLAAPGTERVRAFDRHFLFSRAAHAALESPLAGTSLRAGLLDGAYTPTLEAGGRFGLADELDLRARERVNDPRRRSRLEAVLAGRHVDFPRFSPLRDDRNLEIESLARDRTTAAYTPGGPATPAVIKPDGLPDPSAYLQAKADVRQHLTTLSGARPLVSTTLQPGTEGKLSAAELRVDVNAALAQIQSAAQQVDTSNQPAPNWAAMQEGITTIFSGAVDALLPYARENDNADPRAGSRIAWDTTARPDGMTLNYGGGRNVAGATPQARNNSGEVALRAAAHWTANLIASRQTFRNGTNPTDPPEAADRPVMFAVPLGGKFELTAADPARTSMLRGPTNGAGDIPDNVPLGATDNLNDFPAAFPAEVFAGLVAGGAVAPRIAARLDADAGLPIGAGWPTQDGTLSQRLAPRTGTGKPPALSTAGITVYGITPQPFITHAGVLLMYAARELEGSEDLLCDEQDGEKLILDGKVTRGNKSYLMEAMAVQLHNPFDAEVSLGGHIVEAATGRVVPRPAGMGISPTEIVYYVEFGGRIYGICEYDEPSGAIASAGVLAPGETRTFYFTDQSFADIAARWVVASSDFTADAGAPADATAVRTFLENQFVNPGSLTPAARCPVLDYQLFTVKPYTDLASRPVGVLARDRTSDDPRVDQSSADAGDPRRDKEVRLWRVQRNALSDTPDRRPHDILVDRLHDPERTGRGGFDRELKDKHCVKIAGNTSSGGGPALALFGAVRRPADTGPLGGGARGVLPLYCVESKGVALEDVNFKEAYRRASSVRSLNARLQDEHSNGLVELNFTIDEAVISTLPPWSDPVRIREPVANKLGTLVRELNTRATTATTRVIPDLDTRPQNFTATIAGYPQSDFVDPDLAGVNQAGLTTAAARLGLTLSLPVPQDSTRRQRTPGLLGSAVPLTPLRPMDLLAVPAFGAWHDPDAKAGTAGPQGIDQSKIQELVQWTTLSEAAALAMGFDAAEDPTSPEYAFAGLRASAGGAVEVEAVLNRGRLRTDAFFAYLDPVGDRVFDGAASLPRGQRLPLALGMLDRFTTLPGVGGLTQSVPGVVNMNTAPVDVLRAVPMLSPDFARGYDPATGVPDPARGSWPAQQAWADDANTARWFDPAITHWDGAAMLAAYRDKLAVRLRNRADPLTGEPVDPAAFSLYANFRDDSVQTPPTVQGAPADRPAGRAAWTQRATAREAGGLASVGELLSVRYGLDTPLATGSGVIEGYALPAPGVETLALQSSSIDRFVRDEVVNERPGTPVRVVPFTDQPGPGGVGKQPVTGFGGRLVRAASTTADLLTAVAVPPQADSGGAIADAVLNTVSVRSDTFCVWFVIHGYRREDVEGLRATDPMTPCVARRFVMVVDRSNVITLGQKPRILMLEEVPYN